MRTVWIYKGLPASSKTTTAKEIIANSNCSIKRINKDDLRLMLDSGKYSKSNEDFVLLIRDNILIEALIAGKNIIIDDTNFHEKHEKRIREIVREYNSGLHGRKGIPKNPVQVKVRFFPITPEEAIKRDLKRPNSVGSIVIMEMYNKFLKPKEERFVLKQDESLPHVALIDLDGTIALMNNRSPYDYDKCDTDLPNRPIIDIVETYLSYKGGVIFLSGRDSRAREKTLKWIKDYVQIMDKEFKLFMRKAGDNRKDCIIKKELFDEHIKDKYYIDFVLDDRNQIIQLWRSLGLTCLQVADGDF